MALRIAINGFGRIGRNVLRAGWDDPDLEFVHINELASPDMLAYLLRRDSVQGSWGEVETSGGGLRIHGVDVPLTSLSDPSALPWRELQVDVVLECTGVFTDADSARAHLDAGARKVLISAPGKNVDGTFVFGVNSDDYDADRHHIVSNASCTTNCLAPAAMVLHNLVGIDKGLITTVHSYTMDQNLLDNPHRKGNFRRARAAAQNIVPTSTGAAKAIGLVLPALAGRLNGMAIRVPTPDVSLIDLVFQAQRDTTVEEINAAFVAAAEGPLRGVLEASNDELVSTDLIGNPHSSIVDLKSTQVIGGNLVKVLTWYDNEWGFSNRMLSLAKLVGGSR